MLLERLTLDSVLGNSCSGSPGVLLISFLTWAVVCGGVTRYNWHCIARAYPCNLRGLCERELNDRIAASMMCDELRSEGREEGGAIFGGACT
jgi:hypothetical protein